MNTLLKIILFALLTVFSVIGVVFCLISRKKELERQKLAHVRKSKKSAPISSRAQTYSFGAAVAGAFALAFGIWGIYIFLFHALPGDGYVKTDIVIAENGYGLQVGNFTDISSGTDMFFTAEEFEPGTIFKITDWYLDSETQSLWYAVELYAGGVIPESQEDWPWERSPLAM